MQRVGSYAASPSARAWRGRLSLAVGLRIGRSKTVYTDSIKNGDVADSGQAIDGPQSLVMTVPGCQPQTDRGLVAAWEPGAILEKPLAYE